MFTAELVGPGLTSAPRTTVREFESYSPTCILFLLRKVRGRNQMIDRVSMIYQSEQHALQQNCSCNSDFLQQTTEMLSSPQAPLLKKNPAEMDGFTPKSSGSPQLGMKAFHTLENKDFSSLNVVSVDPLNVETQREILMNEFITPTSKFFVRCNGNIPIVSSIQDYELVIEVNNKQVTNLTLPQLLERFDAGHTIHCTIQCNKSQQPAATTGEFAGTAKFTGIKLRTFLAKSLKHMLRPEEYHNFSIVFEGLDQVSTAKASSDECSTNTLKSKSYQVVLPLPEVMDTDALLALKMNDETLLPCHGYPIRVIIPGYANACVKWLHKIRIVSQQSLPKGSVVSLPELLPRSATPLQENVVVVEERKKQTAESQDQIVIRGFANAGPGRVVGKVSISLNNGKSWKDAVKLVNLGQKADPELCWTFWEFEDTAPPGQESSIQVRTESLAKPASKQQ